MESYEEINQTMFDVYPDASLLHQAIGSALITDRNSAIEYVNPGFTKIACYLPEEIIGKIPAILNSDTQTPSFYKKMWETITRGEVWNGTIIDKKKDGSFYSTLMSVVPIKDAKDEITHYVLIQQDLTEKQRLEEQLLQSQKMGAIGILAYEMAHEFNNIQACILADIYLAKGILGDNVDVIHKLEKVEALTSQATVKVNQLLTFARKDSIKMNDFSLTLLFSEAIQLTQSTIPEGIEFIFNLPERDMVIHGGRIQLELLIMSLLNNACDAVTDVSQPTIHCQLKSISTNDSFREKYPDLEEEEYACLTVSDNGCGIPQEIQERVFLPFFTTKAVGKGEGLGLSVVDGAVRRHNGAVELKSTLGKGTTFHIYLPKFRGHNT